MPHSYPWAALLGLLALAGAARAQPAAFAPVVSYSTGASSGPNDLAVADVNGDGVLDAVVTNYSTRTVAVLLGTGTGSFGAATAFSTGANCVPVSLAVADVNADGKLDLLTANLVSNTAGVLLGTGTGSFGAATTFSVGGNDPPQSIAVADVNADGKPDLLTANYNSSSVAVLLGTGTGSFSLLANFDTGTYNQPSGMAVADVNQDGKPDVLTASPNTHAIVVLLGTGAGGFSPATVFSAGAGNYPIRMAIADVNGDGLPDVVTADYNANLGAVLPGIGAGSFGPATPYDAGAGSYAADIAVADVNGDGRPDLLTANSGTSTAGVLLGLGLGTFSPVTAFGTGAGSRPYAIAVADVNGDQRPDLLTVNQGNNTVGVLLNAGTYTPLATATNLAATTVALYPNPAQGRVQVAVPAVAGATTMQATLLDALGRVVRQQTAALPATGTTLTLDTAGLAAGVYTLRLQAGQSVLARRVVVQ